MKQNLPLNQAILTVEQLDKEYPFVDLLLDTELTYEIKFSSQLTRVEKKRGNREVVDDIAKEVNILSGIDLFAI